MKVDEIEWVVTLDVTVEAASREDAFSKVEVLLRGAKAYCLYDAEIVDQEDKQNS